VQHSTGDTADLRATLTVKGITLPLTLPSTVRALDDGSVRITVQTTVDRAKFDVTGNQLGMLGKTTTLAADALFARA
jgi:polyisoprenoid-binding protein YceI